MLAYHGDAVLKDKLVAKIFAHRQADEIAQGAYVKKNGRTTYCAVGCLLEDPEGGHRRYESEFGIPAQLAHLEDSIFEALPEEAAKLWPERFMGAIPVGADLSKVWPNLAVWLMVDEKWGLVNTTEAEDVKAVCERIADAYTRIAAGDAISDLEAEEITNAARAAWAAWDAWATNAAWAARAARAARDAWDARAAFVEASADKLVELLAEAPIVEQVAT